jgi:hypothetical protein
MEKKNYETMQPSGLTAKGEARLEEGLKYDQGKIRYDLLPFRALHEVARVFTVGAEKYDARNWEKGMDYSKIFAALHRHLSTWWGGSAINHEDGGLLHLAQVAWCALALLHYTQFARYQCFDDRPWYGIQDKEETQDVPY